jgi:hypothetical protein
MKAEFQAEMAERAKAKAKEAEAKAADGGKAKSSLEGGQRVRTCVGR